MLTEKSGDRDRDAHTRAEGGAEAAERTREVHDGGVERHVSTVGAREWNDGLGNGMTGSKGAV